MDRTPSATETRAMRPSLGIDRVRTSSSCDAIAERRPGSLLYARKVSAESGFGSRVRARRRRGGVERRQLELKGVEGGDRKRGVGGEKRTRTKVLEKRRSCVANAVAWGPAYRTHLGASRRAALARELGVERRRDRRVVVVVVV
eukprot:30797-Pelagococcus_subviridis.AAC.2